ncbi:MAG: isochorismate synthase [Caldilineaceae bacterium]|nr:isochorismate synthase [Caldilineaceae bacterium]MDE0338026.1 isochorismate synthase [Caldilineaceae bacterium]
MTVQNRVGEAAGRNGPELTEDASWLEGAGGGGDEYSVQRHGRLVSASRPVADLPFERFLQAASGQERFFWRDGRQGITFAGSGVAAHLIGYGRVRFAAIQRQAKEIFAYAETRPSHRFGQAPRPELALPRLFGGFAFREDFLPDMTWTGFHPGHFILPHYQFVEQDGLGWLTMNALLPPEDDAAATFPLLEEALDAQAALLARGEFEAEGREVEGRPQEADGKQGGLAIDYPLGYDDWVKLIENALLSFDATPLEKVVLSRIAQLRAPQPLIIRQMLSHLCADYPDCFSFLFEPQPGHAFLGATPELLARVQGVELETMALAGSIERGATADEDAELAAALLASTKDRHEHALVVNALRVILQPLCRQLNVASEPTVLALSNIQHLYTPVKARLHRPEGVLPLVEALHPTPAMGGTPRELGMAFIRENEPTLRGWYAAPVGWIDSNMEGAFAAAIRSAVVQKERAWAYAGAGIVPGSVPLAEWEETNWKFQPVIRSVVDGEPA